MPIFVIPNYNDMADWNNPPYENKGDGVVIGYMGSVSHYEDFEMMKRPTPKGNGEVPESCLQYHGANHSQPSNKSVQEMEEV